MKQRAPNPDRLRLRSKKGIWKRYLKLFTKCRLPLVWIVIYEVLDLGVVNFGLNETDYTAQLFAGDTSPQLLAKLIGTMIFNLFAASFIVFAGNVTSARTNRNMRNSVLDKVTRLPMTFFKEDNPREATYRIMSNSSVISSTLIFVLLPIITAAYTAVATVGRVFTYDWRLSLILIAFAPIQVLLGAFFGRINYSLSERSSAVSAGLVEKLAEIITNIPLTKAFAKEQKETEKGTDLINRIFRLDVKGSWLSQFKDLSETVLSLLKTLIIVAVGVALLRGGTITKRGWISFFMFSGVFSGAISNFMMYWGNLKSIQGGAERLADIMDAPEENRKGKPCKDLQGDIVLEDVHFAYDPEKPVLQGLNCRIQDGCTTAILGPSGCGKTTLVNLLLRLYAPDSGSITAGGAETGAFALDEYRSQFVMMSQNSMLFSGTVRENVCYGNGTVSEEAINDALRRAGAYDFVSAMPQGLDTPVQEYGGNLSGGQRQRLALARALLSQGHYLILDEPAAAMDAIATAELMDTLKQAAEGKTMIIIAHTADILPITDRVLVIENGVAAAEGTVDEAMEQSAFLRAFARGEVQA